MQRAVPTVALIMVCCAACATVEPAPPDARLIEAQKAFDEGQRLGETGKYSEAIPLVEHALELREAALGGTHPSVGHCLNLLGDLHRLEADYVRAESLLQRALAILEAAHGKQHPDVAQSLHNLAALYEDQGQHARAESLYERALAIREVTLGPQHPDVAQTLNGLGVLHEVQGDYARAEQLHERALAIREATFGPQHSLVAESLGNLAVLHDEQGDFVRAEPLYKRALAMEEATLGPQHPRVALSLNNLGMLYKSQGNYARAEPLYQRALAIREVTLGPRHPDVAQSLNNLARLYDDQGNYARAEALYERALAIYQATLGEDHPRLAVPLNNLASIYKLQADYARAEPLFARALAISEAALGKQHPNVASLLNNMASLYQDQGDPARAEPLYERALTIRQAALGEKHPMVAHSLNNLARLYQSQGDFTRARPLYERAIGILEATLGPQHPDVARGLANLASLYKTQGDYARAEPLYERALAIRKAALGEQHPDVASSLNTLAELYQAQGNSARAEPLYERAITLREATLGKDHPDVAISLEGLARLRLAQQRLGDAMPLFERAFAISEQHLRKEVYGFSEARLANALYLLRMGEERLYELARSHPENAQVRHLALTAALLRKGRSVEEIANTSRIVYRGLGQEERATFERLRALRTLFSNLSLAGPGKLSADAYQQRLQELADQGDALEAELARRSAPLRALRALPPPSEVMDRVASTLPKDGALVEFVSYRAPPLVPNPGAAAPSQPRYLALLLFSDGRTQALDLGPAARIDAAALRLRDTLASNSFSYLPEAQALHALAFQPLVPRLGKVQRLFLSPDGQLSLVPFAALHDGRSFLVDAWNITYLTSGKELLPRSENLDPSHSVIVLADPDFGSLAAAPLPISQSTPASTRRSASLERFFSTLRADFADRPVPPLPGTRKEAESIRRLLPQARLLLGSAASKEALMKLATPGILHIATHGFFLEDAAAPAATRAVVQPGGLAESSPLQLPPDPLLRSGLVLAGAHATATGPGPQRREDSLVTALELAGLDLWGTQLVVLSACDTGRGNVKPGQGVYGLRRALVVAGTETLVTSLWKVNDEATQELMEGYYRHMVAGLGRTSALREAMKELRRKRPHPHFWAAFIALGRDEPLQGLAPALQAPTAP
ncbi:CHAT domain-containing tetratricopeptide repeat protein [Hyalangium versicolor]|uniref:CHAT domain-containing tetratricopeptide repeat protein n=1 Tax=Hyalangium versicolor TaxID=2861190 RepID=UPI001CCD71B4|nr:tetratricopeptide repeat protein [Hyalangium versicolor]